MWLLGFFHQVLANSLIGRVAQQGVAWLSTEIDFDEH
jgi:hypothetical protein